MSTILTLSEYKAVKGITTSDYDSQLTAMIPMVNNFIEKYCHREFGIGIYTEQNEGTVDYLGRFFFYVKNKPLLGVQNIAIKYYGVPTPINFDLTQVDVFIKAGYAYGSMIGPQAGISIREEYKNNFYYTIIYSGGEAVPPAVKLAAIEITSDMMDNFLEATDAIPSGQQEGKLRSIKIGDYTETYQNTKSAFNLTHNAQTGVVLSQTAKDLLAAFVAYGQGH